MQNEAQEIYDALHDAQSAQDLSDVLRLLYQGENIGTDMQQGDWKLHEFSEFYHGKGSFELIHIEDGEEKTIAQIRLEGDGKMTLSTPYPEIDAALCNFVQEATCAEVTSAFVKTLETELQDMSPNNQIALAITSNDNIKVESASALESEYTETDSVIGNGRNTTHGTPEPYMDKICDITMDENGNIRMTNIHPDFADIAQQAEITANQLVKGEPLQEYQTEVPSPQLIEQDFSVRTSFEVEQNKYDGPLHYETKPLEIPKDTYADLFVEEPSGQRFSLTQAGKDDYVLITPVPNAQNGEMQVEHKTASEAKQFVEDRLKAASDDKQPNQGYVCGRDASGHVDDICVEWAESIDRAQVLSQAKNEVQMEAGGIVGAVYQALMHPKHQSEAGAYRAVDVDKKILFPGQDNPPSQGEVRLYDTNGTHLATMQYEIQNNGVIRPTDIRAENDAAKYHVEDGVAIPNAQPTQISNPSMYAAEHLADGADLFNTRKFDTPRGNTDSPKPTSVKMEQAIENANKPKGKDDLQQE